MSFYFINYASVLLNDTSAGVRILNEGEWINSSGNWNNDVFSNSCFLISSTIPAILIWNTRSLEVTGGRKMKIHGHPLL